MRPLIRCRNFDDNGSRKMKPNGNEVQCRPQCSFIHPSDRDWDRAHPTTRGGPPHGGRGQGQSSGVSSGANSISLGPERTNSSSAWGDYMTSVGSNPSTTSSARGPSFRSSQNTQASSGWGDSGASGSGWGSSANNNAGSSDGWSNEPVATRRNAPPWDDQSAGWGSTDNGWDSFNNVGWGATGNGLGPGWGQDSNSNQGSKAPLVATIPNTASPPGFDARPGGGRSNDNPGASTSTTRSSQAILSVITSSESKQVHNEQRVEDIPMVDPLPLGREALSAASPEQPLPLNQVGNEPQIRPVPDSDVMSDLLGSMGSEMSQMMMNVAVTLNMRMVNAEISQFSVLRKSRQLGRAFPRAAINHLETKSQKLKDAQMTLKAEHRIYSQRLPQSDFLGLPVVWPTSATHPWDNDQLDQLKDWVSKAEGCLSHDRVEGTPTSPANGYAGASFKSKLMQLTERSESLAGTHLPCHDLQLYNALLDHQIQDKKETIVATIVGSQDKHHSHLLSTSLSTFQRHGEMLGQSLQVQAGGLAQALLQSHQLEEEGKVRSSTIAEQNGIIQQLQTSVSQKASQLQLLQEEIRQLQHNLALMKQEQPSHITIDSYVPHIQQYIQGYIEAETISDIKIASSKAVEGFLSMDSITVEKVWKALQPSMQMSIWLQHSDIHNTEEEIEMKEIEQSLLP